MASPRDDFGSADDIEAGRIALECKRVIRAGGGHGIIELVVRDNLVVESYTKIKKHHHVKKRGNG